MLSALIYLPAPYSILSPRPGSRERETAKQRIQRLESTISTKAQPMRSGTTTAAHLSSGPRLSGPPEVAAAIGCSCNCPPCPNQEMARRQRAREEKRRLRGDLKPSRYAHDDHRYTSLVKAVAVRAPVATGGAVSVAICHHIFPFERWPDANGWENLNTSSLLSLSSLQ